MRATYIEEEEMSDMCRHQREKLQGITQTGACYVCCPWMFPPPERVQQMNDAIANWRGRKIASEETPIDEASPAPATPFAEQRAVEREQRRRWLARATGRDWRSVSSDEMSLVRPCWRTYCNEVLEASGERWWPFHSSLHVCPEHGAHWWLLGPGEAR